MQMKGNRQYQRKDPGPEYGQGQGKDQVPPPRPGLPYNNSLPVGHFMAPHRCPHCEDIPDNIFPLPPYSVDDPSPPPHYEDLFPPGYTPFPNPNTYVCPISMTRLPTPSVPLDPPPLYDFLFATAGPPDSTVAPQISQIIGATLIYGIQMLSRAGTCSSSPPPYLNFYIIFNSPAQTPIKKQKKRKKRTKMHFEMYCEEEALPPKWSKYILTCEYMFLFFFDLTKFHSCGCLIELHPKLTV